MTRAREQEPGGEIDEVGAMRWRRGTTVILLAIGWVCAGSSFAQQPAATTSYATSLDAPEDLAARIATILEDPALARAHVGLVVQVAETGEILFDLQGDKLFVPASNTKIVTAAVALEALGPAYRWETTLAATGQIREGVLEGDLWITGSGDPWLSRETVRSWPALLRRAGIERITGDVIGDDRRFVGPQWGEGWFWHEIYASWASGVSALQVRPNTVRADLIPGARVGDRARFQLRHQGPGIPMETDVRTGAPGSDVRLHYELPPEGGDVRLTGWIPAGDTVPLHLATHHPTLYLLNHLEQAVGNAGIEVNGSFRRAAPEEAPGPASWSHGVVSDSLGAAIAEMLKPSDNQVAESILRTVGYEAGAEGSAEAGLDVARGILAGWGIERGAMALSDGSGLSRYNRIAPSAMARLLRSMWQHPEHAVFLAGLPVAAVDGTMRSRLSGTPAEENVRAKTGSLAAARALSGYLTDGAGETLVFSLMLNDYEVSGSVAVALEDLIIEQIALYRRPVQPGWPQYREEGP
ncbi:MAG: D-alanyl-D-alanine carboxypeptidase/D-alanyl-D-alanine-endopeptidase [marine benthic group bacterium]|nr:D-alanyl-D-alanine carboxypeptidase/D-alanyl-D-alanine-endopeptidase [Candidatus Benthicola marisminoris]